MSKSVRKSLGRVAVTHEVWCEMFPWYRYPFLRFKEWFGHHFRHEDEWE